MTYTARDLITKAYYTSGVVSKDYQTLTGDQLAEGLDLLNEFLAIKSVTTALIPYYTYSTITGVVGQEKYTVTGLLEIDTFTFDLTSDIRLSMSRRSREQYFGSTRINNVNSLPVTWRAERVKGGMDVYVYFPPQAAYTFRLWGKYALTQVTSETFDLSTVYDLFYIAYMRYGLAEMICEFYGITLQPQSSQKLRELEQQFKSISPKDYTLRKVTAFRQPGTGWGWGDVFIGHGYRPG